jgi:hypothetical protein
MNSVDPKLRSFGGRSCRPTASKTTYSSLLAVVTLAAVILAGFMFTSAARGQKAQTDAPADTQLSSAQLAERTIERRAVEAVIWGMPAVNYDLMYQAAVREAKGGFNQIIYWSRLPDWKIQTLTPNPDAIYLMPFINTKDVGPVVLEIPPADEGSITGTVMDVWQSALEDVGPAGVDKGQGGKYLVLPPGYKDELPAGYIPLPSDTYQGYALLRSIPKSGSEPDVAKAVAYGKRVKLYPLSQAAKPPATTFVDVVDVVYDSTITYDLRFFESLNRIVQAEPWLERDKAMIDQLKSIGIEKGKPFNPDPRTKEALNDAAREAHAWLVARYEASFSSPYYEGSHWVLPGSRELLEGQATFFAKPDVYPVDVRGVTFSYAYFTPKHVGAGSSYLLTISDKDGRLLDGTTYRLTVPANAPVRQYWSATVYDRATHALIRNARWPSRSSQTPGLQKNADGSVDVYFGPKASADKESNWVPTSADGGFEVLFRFYGPEKPLFDKTWQLPDIEKINLSEGGAVKESASATPALAQNITQQEAYEIAKDAYVYGYPLLLVDVTMRRSTNYAEPTGLLTQAPFNQFSHAKAFPPADYKGVVRANVDTLYSSANLDLDPVAMVLSVPAIDRYFLLQMLSMWTDVFAAPGTRTIGRNSARDFLLVGPRWQGEAPPGLKIIRSPTRFMTIGGRTQTNGVADYENVHKIQAGYKLTPLSAWGKGEYVPPKGKVDPTIDMKTPPPDQVDKMDAATFFARLAKLLKDNPPGPCDYPMIHRLERVGFKVGQSFDLKDVPPDMRRAFERAAADGKAMVANLGKKAMGEGGKGWTYSTHGGAYGVDYMYRAAIAYGALGENLPQDAIYPSVSTDSEGKPLDGNSAYILHFDKGRLPPVDAFWSVTAYDTDGYFIPNALKRQAIGDRDKLQFNPDGSLDLHIQADSPGPDKEANWLPVAKAPFTLLMRLYSPKAEILDGSWTPPPVKRVK